MLLNKNRDLVDLRFVLLRILLEFLQIFRVVFNVYMAGWSIDASNVGYKAIKWVLIRWGGMCMLVTGVSHHVMPMLVPVVSYAQARAPHAAPGTRPTCHCVPRRALVFPKVRLLA